MHLSSASEITVAILSEQQPVYDGHILPVKALLPQCLIFVCNENELSVKNTVSSFPSLLN